MRQTSNSAYNDLICACPVKLRKKLTPHAFSPEGDKVVLLLDPKIPTIGNCSFYQPISTINSMQRKQWIQKAKSLGIASIPSVHIDLDHLHYEKSIDVLVEDYELEFTFKPVGDVTIVYGNTGKYLSLHTNKEVGHVNLTLFEKMFFGKWKVSVTVRSNKSAVLKLTCETNSGEFELEGDIKRGDLGLEATLYPTGEHDIIEIHSLLVSGKFGFKVEISGEWEKWVEDDYIFEDQIIEFSSVIANTGIAIEKINIIYLFVSAASLAYARIAPMVPILLGWLSEALDEIAANPEFVMGA